MKKDRQAFFDKLSKLGVDEHVVSQYLRMRQKARKKLRDMRYQGKTINVPKLPKGYGKPIKDIGDFYEAWENIQNIISSDYRIKRNQEYRGYARENLERLYGKGQEVDYIMQELNKMTDNELIDFFNRNDDLKGITFAYQQSLIVDLTGLTAETFISRLNPVLA